MVDRYLDLPPLSGDFVSQVGSCRSLLILSVPMPNLLLDHHERLCVLSLKKLHWDTSNIYDCL